MLHLDRGAEAGSRNAEGVHEQVAFIETGQELRAETAGHDAGHQDQCRRGHHRDRTIGEGGSQRRAVHPQRRMHQHVLLLRHAAGHEDRQRRRHEGQRQDHGARQRGQHRERHREEHLPLDAGQGQDRQVDDHDDQLAEDGGAAHLARGLEHHLEPFGPGQQATQFMLPFAQAAHAVFDDVDGAIDDDAEVERAQAQQVAAHAALNHPGDGEQHRERDDAGGDHRRTNVAEEHEQDQDHQQRANQQVVLHGRDGRVHQLRAVVDGLRHHAGRQGAVDLGHAVGHAS